MYFKLRGIVLHHIKFKDNSVIVYLYTDLKGRQTYISKGIHKHGRSHLQPLSIIDFDINMQPNKGMPMLSNYSRPSIQANLLSNVYKSAISLFISELLSKLLREEEANVHLFQFIHQSICYLDAMESGTANFHLYFMVQLAKYMGFSIPNNNQNYAYFDIKAAEFVANCPSHLMRFGLNESTLLSQLTSCSVANLDQLELNRQTRSNFASQMIDFYNYHFDHLLPMQSLGVLHELFS